MVRIDSLARSRWIAVLVSKDIVIDDILVADTENAEEGRRQDTRPVFSGHAVEHRRVRVGPRQEA